MWKQQASEWEHLKHLKFSICTGYAKDRLAALQKKADIYVINRENVQWLVDTVKWDFDAVIIDESSSFKSHRSKRFRAMNRVKKNIDVMLLLTGTPSPNSLSDLWSQLYLIDGGERLGKTISNFHKRFFKPAGYMGYGWKASTGADDEIKELIRDVCVYMESDDYIELPDKIVIKEWVEMPADAKKAYDKIETEFFVKLDEGEVDALTAGVLVNKLLQMCNGAVYDQDRKVHHLHDAKIEALKEIIEDNPNENLLVAYAYQHDLARLRKAFPDAEVLSKDGKEVKKWNEGKIKMLLAHPASAGHGLNFQYGGSVIIWFGLNWSLELYEQFNARLHRQGQEKPVRLIHLVAKDSVDMRVLWALAAKAKTQEQLLEYLKRGPEL